MVKFLFKGKKFQALTLVGRRRMIMRRVNLEKMERKGRREGVSSLRVLIAHSWLELLPDDVHFILAFLTMVLVPAGNLCYIWLTCKHSLWFVLLTQDAISSPVKF